MWSTTPVNIHSQRHCHGPAPPEPDQSISLDAGSEFDSEEEEQMDDEEEELDEIMAEVNDDDQTLLGAGLGGGNAEEEEQALRLQEHLSRQRLQRERTPPREDREERWEDLWGRFRALNNRPSRRQRMASPASRASPSSSDSSRASPSSSDSSRVVDDEGRPVIPDPVDPLPLPSPTGGLNYKVAV